MKKFVSVLFVLFLMVAFSNTVFANVYATDVQVSKTTIALAAADTTIISFRLNENADLGVDVKIYNSSSVLVRTISLTTAEKGVNSVVWDGKDDSGDAVAEDNYSFEVTASDDGYTEWTKISVDTLTVMYSPKGAAINRDPNSPYFGRIYIANGHPGTSSNTGAFYNGDGVYMYNSTQDTIAFSDGGVDWSSSSNSPYKTTIGSDGSLYICDYGHDWLYQFDPDISVSSALLVLDDDNRVENQWLAANWVSGTGADRAIYTADAHYSTGQGIKKYDIGLNATMPDNDVGYVVIERPNGLYYQNDVEVGSDGSIYFCQKRSAKGDITDKDDNIIENGKPVNEAYPLLKYPAYTGTILTIDDTLWAVPMTYTGANGIALDEARNRVAWGDYYSGKVYVHNATTGELLWTVNWGNRTQDIAFDAVGNLYKADNSAEYWTIMSPPDGANSYTTPGLTEITVESGITVQPGDVVVNEIGEPYDMTNTWEDSYIELYNTTDAAIDVSGWVVWSIDASKGTSSFELPSGTEISANGYLIATRDRTKFLEDYGTYVDSGIVPDAASITGSGVYIKNNYYFALLTATGDTIDYTSSTVAWNSQVYEKTTPDADGTVDDNWYLTYQSDPVQGTPGHENSSAPPVTNYTITEIQDTTGTGSSDSPHAGEMVRTTGIVTGVYATESLYTIQDGTGAFTGIWISDATTVAEGDEVTLKGMVSESYGLTMITADSSGINSSGNTVPAAEVLATGAVAAEAWEGVLVYTTGVCDDENPDDKFSNMPEGKGDYGEWTINDGTGSIRIDDLGYLYEPVLAKTYEVTGPLYFSFYNFKIEPRDADDIVELTNDLNLTFEDDSDVANWGVYDGTSGYTTVAHDPTGGVGGTGAIVFGDGGYGFYIKRPIVATVGTDYQLSIDVKTSGWDNAPTYPIALSIEGLEDVPPSASINGLTDFTTITLTGSATNDSGYIVIAGSNTAGHNDVWIDNLVYDDDAVIPDTIAPTLDTVLVISDTTLGVVFSEDIDVTTGETVTNYSIDRGIGNPVSATVLQNIVTLKVSQLTPDSLYTLTVNNVEDLANNPIDANSVITFKYVEYIPVPDLFFSEYIEGTSQNKALEIYNGSGNIVNLSNYVLKGTHNGDNDWDYCSFQFPDIELAAGDVYVLATTDADDAIQAFADTVLAYDDNKIVYYNGDDARGIFKNGILLDIIGIPDEDPGTAWDVAGVSGATAEHTLIRKATVTMGNTDWTASAGTDEATSEWVVMPQNTFRFLGSHPHTDFAGPEIAGVVTIGDSLVQVKFSEQVDSAAAVNVANYTIDGGIGNPVSASIICMHIVTLKFDTGHLLVSNTDYTMTVSNVPDLIGNVISPNTTVLVHNLVPGDLPIDIVSSDFETGMGTWQVPTYSGSTSGILTTSTFELSDEQVYDGAKSAKMNLLDDPAKTGWFVRVWNSGRPDVAIDSKIFMYVKATNPDIQIRFHFRDDGTGGDNEYLVSPWIDITAHKDDWQVVGVDLMNTPLSSWVVVGDGVIGSSDVISIDAITLQCPSDVDAVLYFDKLTERQNIAPVEVTFEVSMAVQSLLGNFNIASDFVDIAGNFNDWGGNSMVLDDSDGDSVYSITVVDLYPGENLEYKFRINGSWDDATCEFPFGGPNRTYVVPDTNSVVFHWYDDKDRSFLGIEDITALPKEFALHQNYPNPFNPTTFIKYDLPKEAKVKIVIYNLMGREVRTLVNEKQNAGYKSILWNGRDNQGRMVSSGLYIYQMITDEFQKTKKMTFLK